MAGAHTDGSGPADTWLSERERAAWRGLAGMSAHLGARLSADLRRDSGLSMADYAVLVAMSETPGGEMRAIDLGAALQWNKSRLSKQVSRMEARGLLARAQCASDGRGSVVVLTAAGRRSIEHAAPLHVARVKDLFFAALAPEQIGQLAEITESVLAHLEALDGSTGGDARAAAACDEDDSDD